MPIGSTSTIRIGMCPIIRSGGRRSTGASSRARAAKMARQAKHAAGRRAWRPRLAAVTHVDGSARLQTLEREMAPRLYALLDAYGRRTGIPVLLNTSFNVAGEPIVTRALEGYSTFRRCGMDVLVAGPTLVMKRALSPVTTIKEAVA